MSYTNSKDNSQIYYEVTGNGKTALLLVHGWLGNVRWWDATRDYFKSSYQVVTIDLGGHGKSDKNREPSVENYVQDIVAVAKNISAEKIILVGHSMSGGYVMEASHKIAKTSKIVLVDTLQNLDFVMVPEQINGFAQTVLQDYETAVNTILKEELFQATSPQEVVKRVLGEFLLVSPEVSMSLLIPFFEHDFRGAAKRNQIPVCAVNADKHPTNMEACLKYLKDFKMEIVKGVGHYPMLEKPLDFNQALEKCLP
ncbi:MAG: alpha/beta fold hydrolase [Bacteriovoracaceae bacterium]